MAGEERGATLVDMVIAATLLVVVFGLTIPGFMLAEDTITTGGTRDQLERTGDRILSEILGILRSGRLASISPPGGPPSLTVHRVRTDIELDDLTEETPDLFEPDPVVISFRTARILAESALRTDLNRDGDLADEFALGGLDLSDGEHARTFSGRPVALLGLPSFQGDLDGDAVDDPLFSFDGATVSVSLRLVSVEPGGRVLSASLRGSVKPRNSQE
ncbi:MAG: hypothetical protein MUE73_09905 [Planctomycetes bacterium]|jgi:hypothetical protein|nr:hypothetical protein [Planctomycetota bacterium]